MARSDWPGRPSRVLVLAGVAVVIAGLYFAQDFLIPLALSLLLSFLLAPLCHRLERWKLGRVPSVIIVVVLGLGALTGIGWIVTGQVIDLANKLPSYRNNIHSKVERWRISAGNFDKQTQALQESLKDLTAPKPTSVPTTQDLETATQNKPLSPPVAKAVQNLSGTPTTQPIQVQIKERDPGPIQFMKDYIAPYLSPLA